MTVGHTGPMTVGHTGPWLWVTRAHCCGSYGPGPWLWVIRAHGCGSYGPMAVGHTFPWLWVLRKNEEWILERTEMRMLRWIAGIERRHKKGDLLTDKVVVGKTQWTVCPGGGGSI